MKKKVKKNGYGIDKGSPFIELQITLPFKRNKPKTSPL